MTINTFVKKVNLEKKMELEKVEYFAYYYSNGIVTNEFSLEDIEKWLVDSGFCSPNKTRLRIKIKNCKDIIKGRNKDMFRLSLKKFNEIEAKIMIFTNTLEEIDESESIISASLYESTRTYIKLLSQQINACYDNNIFDGCAVLMRRLLEILLIHSFEKNGIDALIRNVDDSFKMLVDIVSIAKSNKILALSRNTKEVLDNFRNIGNFAAHKIFYNTKKSDINSLKISYRATIEELLYKSGIRS